MKILAIIVTFLIFKFYVLRWPHNIPICIYFISLFLRQEDLIRGKKVMQVLSLSGSRSSLKFCFLFWRFRLRGVTASICGCMNLYSRPWDFFITSVGISDKTTDTASWLSEHICNWALRWIISFKPGKLEKEQRACGSQNKTPQNMNQIDFQ